MGVSCLNGSKGWFRTCLEILEQPVFSLTAKGTNCCFHLIMGWVGIALNLVPRVSHLTAPGNEVGFHLA